MKLENNGYDVEKSLAFCKTDCKKTDVFEKLEKNDSFSVAEKAVKNLLEQYCEIKTPLLVAIDGRCGSGKTTLGTYLNKKFDSNLFHMDDFFLQKEQRTKERLEEVGGNVDYERFLEHVIKPLIRQENVIYQPFSCKESKLLDAYEIPYKKLNFIEGAYSMHPYFGPVYQLKIFMDIALNEQLDNIKKRDGIEKAKEFQEKWIPKEEAYFKKFQIQKEAHFIIHLSKNL